ncbi:MAG: sulfite exporter TauE/SafE family protein [Saprospiraceae bacterium]
MEWLQNIVLNSNVPVISAIALGILTAIAPCPLATNITATAYIAKTINSKPKVLLSGIAYIFGRMLSYTSIGALIYFGASKFHLAEFFTK